MQSDTSRSAPRRLEPLKQVFYNAVALGGRRFVQPAHLQRHFKRSASVPEARLRPVGLHRRVKEAVDRTAARQSVPAAPSIFTPARASASRVMGT